MRLKSAVIPLDAVNSGDETYRITSTTQLERLAASLTTAGLINPPVLAEKGREYIIVSGFRRVEAVRSLGWQQIGARIVDSGVSALDRAMVAVCDNSMQRSLNLIETSRALHLLFNLLGDIDTLAKKAAAIGLPDNPVHIRKILKLIRLPKPVQDAVLSEVLTLPMALEIGELTTETTASLIRLFSELKTGLNVQRELLTMIKEIALREDISIIKVLEDPDISAITGNNELNSAQKREQTRRYLKRRRFPNLSRAAETFEKCRKDLKLTNRIQLEFPSHFESATYTFKVDFRNREELVHQISRLTDLVQHPSLIKILQRTP